MGKRMSRLATLALIGAATLPFGHAAAEEPQVTPMQVNVTLLQETSIYASPDAPAASGALAPQQIRVTGAEAGWSRAPFEGMQRRWFQTQTWQGTRWLSLELRQLGNVQQEEGELWLSRPAALLDSPVTNGDTGLALAPQTVHTTAMYFSKFGTGYLLDTWAGPKWIAASDGTFPVQKWNETIVLPTTTSTFDQPVPYGGDSGVIQPQTVQAFEKYGDRWFHVHTATGIDTWINRAFAVPEGATETEETFDIAAQTMLHKYPDVDVIPMGAIAPQQVKASAKWTSPGGTLWIRIASWQGDAWIKPFGAKVAIGEQEALRIGQKMDSSGSAEWSVAFTDDYRIDERDEGRPVWVVTAVYPAGNKMAVYIDAETGRQLALSESEPPGPY
ncbi:PepSY domain-containing protein [Paenibacillus cymbidii]|uniref:PepSY domain-containing protein n=1 Tax=Paenibacillus cymbidii TaxID=1639034 RepID=UPI0010817EDF|nr:PepSY domain-containing protein [Paenibacillus cymbidii]